VGISGSALARHLWSRVWSPVISELGESHEVSALDYPGFGHSEGRLDAEEATAPALAGFVLWAADALSVKGPIAVAGHDKGGAVAQHVAVQGEGRVSRLALVNSVLYDS
jgi:pimeloyl-ACP methyl ester carboxylesterase